MNVGRAFPDVTQQLQELQSGDRPRMVFLVRYFLCCSVLIAMAMQLAVDGRAINAGCGGGNGAGLSSEAVQLEDGRRKEEGMRPLDSAGTSLKGDLVGWEMRWVPSGPDPLHHNSNPKKPQTP